MTINEWIKEYASQNDIDIPSGIGDVNAVLNWLQLQAMDNGGGGGTEISTVKGTLDLTLPEGTTFLEAELDTYIIYPTSSNSYYCSGFKVLALEFYPVTYEGVCYLETPRFYDTEYNRLLPTEPIQYLGDIEYDDEFNAFKVTGEFTIKAILG